MRFHPYTYACTQQFLPLLWAAITVLYRYPSQSISEFDNFLSGFENMFNVISSFKPDFSIIFGDFNARSKSWWQNGINTSEGIKIDALN